MHSEFQNFYSRQLNTVLLGLIQLMVEFKLLNDLP